MRRIRASSVAVLAMAAPAVAETHVIVVDATSIMPNTLEVAPGDTVVFDFTCATIVATGQSCIHDGILTGANSPPNCGGFQSLLNQLRQWLQCAVSRRASQN